jgi:hypothetical protein
LTEFTVHAEFTIHPTNLSTNSTELTEIHLIEYVNSGILTDEYRPILLINGLNSVIVFFENSLFTILVKWILIVFTEFGRFKKNRRDRRPIFFVHRFFKPCCCLCASFSRYSKRSEAKGPFHARWAAIPHATGPSKIRPEGGLIRLRTRGPGAEFAAFPLCLPLPNAKPFVHTFPCRCK